MIICHTTETYQAMIALYTVVVMINVIMAKTPTQSNT